MAQTKVGRQTVNWVPLDPIEEDTLKADVFYNLFGYADNILTRMFQARYDRIKELVGNMKGSGQNNYAGLDAEGSDLTISCLEPQHFADGTNWGQAWTQVSTAARTWETHGYAGTPAVLTTVTVRTNFGHVFVGCADLAGNNVVEACMFRPSSKPDRRTRIYEMGVLLPNNEWVPVMPMKTYTVRQGETFDLRLYPNAGVANLNFALLGITVAPADRLEREVYAGSLV